VAVGVAGAGDPRQKQLFAVETGDYH
jgi:hypothetical protein